MGDNQMNVERIKSDNPNDECFLMESGGSEVILTIFLNDKGIRCMRTEDKERHPHDVDFITSIAIFASHMILNEGSLHGVQ